MAPRFGHLGARTRLARAACAAARDPRLARHMIGLEGLLESSRWNRCSVRIARALPQPSPFGPRRSNREFAAAGTLPRGDVRAEHAQGSCHVPNPSEHLSFIRSSIEHRRGDRAAAAASRAGRHVRLRVSDLACVGAIRVHGTHGRRGVGRGFWARAKGAGPGAPGHRPGADTRSDRHLRELSVVPVAGSAPRSHEHPWSSGGDRGASPARHPSNRVGGSFL